MSEQQLRQELADLRLKMDQVDDWAAGLQKVLLEVLPVLLRGHPEVAKVQAVLKAADIRYEELSENPLDAEWPGESAGLYEPSKMLHRVMGTLGVWPDVDPLESAQAAIERARSGAAQRDEG
ncbi:hypothetical protein [Pseudomonas sp.]|uniref:hypothetical protein n=1 Tax=Pseudomonas sp. TaxID=306 RepID=UPI003242D106